MLPHGAGRVGHFFSRLLLCSGMAVALLWADAESCPAISPDAGDRPAAATLVSTGRSLLRRGIATNMCALTFDDGPGQYTPRLLDLLHERGIHATFFVLGKHAERHPDIIRRMLAEGHEIGNHSYRHARLKGLTHQAQEEDLGRVDNLLRGLGVEPHFVRPPYGEYNSQTLDVVASLHSHLVLWSVDSRDWQQDRPTLGAMQGQYKNAPLRGVFLFHDTHAATIENMPEILDELAATGCRFVTLSEYFAPSEKSAPDLPPQPAPEGTTPPETATPPETGAPEPQTPSVFMTEGLSGKEVRGPLQTVALPSVRTPERKNPEQDVHTDFPYVYPTEQGTVYRWSDSPAPEIPLHDRQENNGIQLFSGTAKQR